MPITRLNLRVSSGAALALALTAAANGQSDPPGCVGSGVGIDLVPIVNGIPSTAPVTPGQEIFYRVSLSQPLPFGCSYQSGQLSVTLPDGALVPAAGYDGTPGVPVVGYGNGPFTVQIDVPYIADADDLTEEGILVARADYGATVGRPDQDNGTVLSSPPTPANSATIAVPLGFEAGECAVEVALAGCITQQGPLDDACDGKVEALNLTYTGEGCEATVHDQDPSKVQCEDSGVLPTLVRVRVSDEENPDAGGGKTWFDGEVALGDSLTAMSSNAGEDHFSSRTYVHVFDLAGDLVQFIEFHTSCSQPLAPGHQFGSMLVSSMTTTAGGTIDLNLGDPGNCLTEIETDEEVDVRYTYSVTNPGKSTINDISVIDDVFGEVPGSPIAALAAGETIELVLETSIFETTTNAASVSVAGAETCVAAADTTVVITPLPADCCENGDKPRVLFMVYTGESCDASSHTQSPDKWSCDDFVTLPETVYIVANDEDEHDDGHLWFEGPVAIGETFEISATNAGENKLKSNTWVHVLTEKDGALLQLIKLHSSCSVPLQEGDQFGSAIVAGCIGEDEPVVDCNDNGVKDELELLQGAADCNGNGIIDECEPGSDGNGNGVPDECECLPDVNDDGFVDVEDLVDVFMAWGTSDADADVTVDGIVDVRDLTEIVMKWGPCP